MQHPTPADVATFITSSFNDTRSVVADVDYFFFADSEQNFPFATIVAKDNDFDSLSNLDREGIFRLNIGLSKTTFQKLFRGPGGIETTDPAALGVLIPHPAYAKMYWASLLNPSWDQLTELLPLLEEAHDLQLSRTNRRGGSERSRDS